MHVDTQGSFTEIMSYVIKKFTGGKLTTIDISEEHLSNCKRFTKEYSDVIEYIHSDSIEYLSSLTKDDVGKIDLFYFDSYDLNLVTPKPSQMHHINELLSVYDKLGDDVILSVDDNYLPGTKVEWIWNDDKPNVTVNSGDKILGKGADINDFLLNNKWKRLVDLEIYPNNNVFVFEREIQKVSQKESFLITTYCDTDEKLKVLNDTIQGLKKYNLDICVHAHYPLPVEVQEQIQYYIYDVSNPIIPYGLRSIIMWRKIGNYQLNILKRDYGYTVASQYKQGLLFLNKLDYDVVHVLNYDTIVTDDNMVNAKAIRDKSAVFYLNSEDEINLLLVTIRPLDFLDEIKTISMKDYIGSNELWYAEKYFHNKFKGNNLYLEEKLQHKNIRHQPDEFYQCDFEDFSIHAGEKINWVDGEKIYTGKFSVVLYEMTEPIDLKINVNGSSYLHELIDDKDVAIINTNIDSEDIKKSFGYYDDNEFVDGDYNIEVFVNDEKLQQDVTSNFCLSAIEFNKKI